MQEEGMGRQVAVIRGATSTRSFLEHRSTVFKSSQTRDRIWRVPAEARMRPVHDARHFGVGPHIKVTNSDFGICTLSASVTTCNLAWPSLETASTRKTVCDTGVTLKNCKKQNTAYPPAGSVRTGMPTRRVSFSEPNKKGKDQSNRIKTRASCPSVCENKRSHRGKLVPRPTCPECRHRARYIFRSSSIVVITGTNHICCQPKKLCDRQRFSMQARRMHRLVRVENVDV